MLGCVKCRKDAARTRSDIDSGPVEWQDRRSVGASCPFFLLFFFQSSDEGNNSAFGQFSHSRLLSLSRLCESGGPPRANWLLQKEFIFVVVLGETGCVLFSVCPWTPQFIHPVQSGQRVAVSLTWTIHFLFCVLIYKHSINVSLHLCAQNSEYRPEYFTAFSVRSVFYFYFFFLRNVLCKMH